MFEWKGLTMIDNLLKIFILRGSQLHHLLALKRLSHFEMVSPLLMNGLGLQAFSHRLALVELSSERIIHHC